MKNIANKMQETYENISSQTLMLNRRYTIGKKIGEGGLSEVYEASDIYSQYFKDIRALVIKVPSPHLADKTDIAAFVYSEYSILSHLHHENIVKVVDFGIDEDLNIPYIVMQKLKGDLLVNVALHTVTSTMKRKIAHALYKAIVYLHYKGVVHADINPTNIMMGADGNAQLFDFGISQNKDVKKHFNLSHKKTHAYNPIYTAPEVLEGEVPSLKTDLFSLACVLYELYTGALPFETSSKDFLKTPLTNRQLHKIPITQRAWFKKALSYDPNNRPEKIPLCIRLRYLLQNCYFE